MKKFRVMIMLSALVLTFSCKTAMNIQESGMLPLLPAPVEVTLADGNLSLSSGAVVFAEGVESELQIVAAQLKGLNGFELVSGSSADAVITAVGQEGSDLPAEGYSLQVSEEGISIVYADAAGAFYAFQSLKQLIFHGVESDGAAAQLQFCDIIDYPQFSWRGLHLDVSRHFVNADEVKSYIDMLADQKMNRFHWHIVDSQGWRMEVKKYPELTEKAAWRKYEPENDWSWTYLALAEPGGDEPVYGGYYTQEEIKEIVAYAAERHVSVLPEVEMPGHSNALLQVHPELLCDVQGSTGQVLYDDVSCPGKDITLDFFKDILEETLELFPSKYIHIGGDEVGKDRWKKCPDCAKRKSDEGLANVEELQSWFIREMEAWLNERGRILIGWDEIIEGGVAPNAVVMGWRGEKYAVEAVHQGRDVVMAPTTYTYLDFGQSREKREPRHIGSVLPLKAVYGWEIIPPQLTGEDRKLVIGGQGQLWTEFMNSYTQVEYMAWPRASALAQKLWDTDGAPSFSAFEAVLDQYLKLMDAREVGYRFPGKAKKVAAVKVSGDQQELSFTLPESMQGRRVQLFLAADKSADYVIESMKLNDENVMPDSKWQGRLGAFQRFNYSTVQVPTSGAVYTVGLKSIGEGVSSGKVTLYAVCR